MTENDYRSDRRQAVDTVLVGYAEMIRQRVDAGWSPYLLTMTFRHLPGNASTVLASMIDEAEHFYRRFVTRVVRRPTSPVVDLPVLVVAPDVPVGKHDKPLRDVVLNDGLHLHGVLLVPPCSRLPIPADDHVRGQQPFYVSPSGSAPRRVSAVDLRPVDHDLDRVVSYALKGLVRGRFSSDHLLVLPRALSEVRDQRSPPLKTAVA